MSLVHKYRHHNKTAPPVAIFTVAWTCFSWLFNPTSGSTDGHNGKLYPSFMALCTKQHVKSWCVDMDAIQKPVLCCSPDLRSTWRSSEGTGGGVVLNLVCSWFQAPSRQVMHYWLQQLQQKRWEYSNTRGQRDSWCSPTLAYPLTGLVGKDNGRQVHTQIPAFPISCVYAGLFSFLSLYKNMNAFILKSVYIRQLLSPWVLLLFIQMCYSLYLPLN